MAIPNGERDKDVDYEERITQRAAAIDDAELDAAYFDLLEDLLGLDDAPYIAGYRIWQHELPWVNKGVTRLGYLLMGTPEARSTAQPARDFYLYFLPICATSSFPKDRPDEIFFRLTGRDDQFTTALRSYAAASALRTESTFTYKRGFDERRRTLWQAVVERLRRQTNDAMSVTYKGETRSLAAWANDPRTKSGVRDTVDGVAASVLVDHFEDRYPGYPVFETAVVPTDVREKVPIHPWFASRQRGLAELAVNLAYGAKSSGESVGREDEPSAGSSKFLDLCSGVATIADAASRQGFDATAVDLSPVATLIARARLDYARDPSLKPASSDWDGLANEVAATGERVLIAARANTRELWPEDGSVDVVLLISTTPCPSCSTDIADADSVRLGPDARVVPDLAGERLSFKIDAVAEGARSGDRRCSRCSHRLGRAHTETRRYVPAAVRTRTDAKPTWTTPPSSAPLQMLAAHAVEDPAVVDGSSIFTRVRGRAVPWSALTSDRQRVLIGALRSAAIGELDRLRGRDLPPRAAEAMEAYLALLVSSALPYLTRATVWSPAGRATAAPARGAWIAGTSYIELGGTWLEGAWHRRLNEAVAAIDETSSRAVDVRRGDARHLVDSDGTFDLAIWDPPFYDNVDYDSLAAPFEQVLRSVAPSHPDLTGAPAHEVAGPFDPAAYQNDLSIMADEAHRVLAAGGHLGVWWHSRSPDELQDLIGVVAGAGLELRSAVAVDTDRAPKSRTARTPRTYLLLFQKATSATPVDAGVVLALADAELPSLYDGVASLLEEEYTESELETMIPDDYRGSLHDRVVEYVATHPSPDELLVDLGRRPLRAIADRLGLESEPNADARHLARLVLAALGFSLPKPPSFSIEAAAADVRRLLSELRLAHGFDDAAAPFRRVEQQVLGAMKLTVLCWARLVAGDEWEQRLKDIVERTGGGRFRGPARMTLGDWKSCFGELPKLLAEGTPSTRALFDAHRRTLKRLKAIAVLDDFVSVRNRVAHPDDEPPALTVVVDAVEATAQLIEDLMANQVLPVVLNPQEERRDRWGRLLLVAVDGCDRTRELMIRQTADLTQPLVWIPRLVNPREVDPILLVAPELESLLV